MAEAATGVFYTAQDAVTWVQEQFFGETYRIKEMYRLLARLMTHPRVPRPFNQAVAWRAGGLERGLRTALQEAGPATVAALGFSDEMRARLPGMVRRVWVPRGVKVQQAQGLVYTWRCLAVVLNRLTGMLHWAWLPSMKKEGIAQLVGAWQTAGVAVLVWDGPASHRARGSRTSACR